VLDAIVAVGVPEKNGVDDGARTRNLWSHSPALSPLSYIYHMKHRLLTWNPFLMYLQNSIQVLVRHGSLCSLSRQSMVFPKLYKPV
jgi:hypothetical protein